MNKNDRGISKTSFMVRFNLVALLAIVVRARALLDHLRLRRRRRRRRMKSLSSECIDLTIKKV